MASLSALQAAQLTVASRSVAGLGSSSSSASNANNNSSTSNAGAGNRGSGSNYNRASLSSFPSSRPPSSMSTASRPLKSPQPPNDLSSFASAYNNGSGVRRPSLGLNTMAAAMTTTTTAATAGSLPISHGNGSAKQHVRSPRRLRSQYPRSSIENHVEYILVASFDIDRGPVMEHQYPVAITGDEHMLAELMLPDQAHARNQDWTIFFLHKDTSQEEDEEEQKEKEARRRRRKRRRDRANGILPAEGEEDEEDELLDEEDDDDEDDWSDDDSAAEEPEGGEGPPLIYVLNLVNTKHDKTVKRGAIVKTMAICTRHPFLHIYKPLLLLALEEYFKAPVPETLAMLYEAVNSMDLSLMPKLSLLERNLLQASDNKDLFVEKFEQIIQRRMARGPTAIERGSPEIPRGADGKQPAIQRAGTKAYLEGHSAFAVPRDTHEFESKVLYKGIPIPVKVPTAIMPETVGDFSLVKLIQQFSEPHTKAPQPFNTHPHLTTNGPLTHPIIVLANALLTQKRIIFLGHNMPSGEVAEAVLAACALASGGVLRGFTRHAFPYTDLTKIDDLLKVPGFIAGVTNPTFEMHPEWWDLLCDLPSGRMKISNRLEQLPPTEGLVYFQQQNPGAAALINGPSTGDLTSDTVFMNDILRSIATRQGERVIRAKWRDWVVKFARMSAAFEESVYGASALYIGGDEADAITLSKGGHGYVWPDENSKQRELAGNVHRIEGWRNTRSYYSFIQDLAQIYTIRPLKGLDLHHLHDRLRTQRLTPAQSREIYLSFANNVITYEEICLLLTVAPESHGGLFYLALGLLHKDRDVRIATSDLLERISEHEAGQHWWKGLSRFEKLAYQRIRKEAEMSGRGGEGKEPSLGAGGGYGMGEIDKRVS